jgi:hypothetical protein
MLMFNAAHLENMQPGGVALLSPPNLLSPANYRPNKNITSMEPESFIIESSFERSSVPFNIDFCIILY